jgi:hypothetical protein
MKEVGIYTVKADTKVSFSTKPPGPEVVTYAAKLFKKSGGRMKTIEKWTASELEAGVEFPFDAEAGERYEIDLAATVTDDAKIDTETGFSKHPPDDDPETVDLDPNEGVIVRVWFFFPVV